MFKVAGTVIEGCGKVIVDVVEAVECETKAYKSSEQYIKDKEQRDEIIAEMKDNWKRIQENTKELAKTYKKGE
jgi:predicted patatin/cPLA2 family phospholipase